MKDIQQQIDNIQMTLLKLNVVEEDKEVVVDLIAQLSSLEKDLYNKVHLIQTSLVEIFQSVEMEEIIELQPVEGGCQ